MSKMVYLLLHLSSKSLIFTDNFGSGSSQVKTDQDPNRDPSGQIFTDPDPDR